MNRYPIIKFVILFIIGIILTKILTISLTYIFISAGILLLLAFVFYFLKKELITAIFLYLLIFLSGLTYSKIRDLNHSFYPFEDPKISSIKVIGEIEDIDLKQEGRITFKLMTDSIKIKNQIYDYNINLLVRVFDEDLNSVYNKLKIGNKIIIRGTLEKGKETRNPGEFNYQKYLESEGISGLFNIYRKYDIKIIDKKSDFIAQTIFQFRKTIDNQLEKNHTKEAYGLLRGLLLADRKLIDDDTKVDFVNSGVVHVLAVSGLHVGYIILIFLFLFSRTNVILRIFLTIIGLVIFLLITNSPPSVFRATIMTLVALSAFLANREYNGINALAIAAIIILLINPNDLFSPGFQLSFSAVASILIIWPKLSTTINKMNIKNIYKKLLLYASVSFAAQIGTLPFTLFYFGKLSIISLAANLVVIPAIGIILPIGILTLITSTFFPWLGMIYASANNLLVSTLFEFIRLLSKIPLAFIDVLHFSIIDGIIFYALVSFLLSSKFKRLRPIIKFAAIILVIANFYIYSKLDNKEIVHDNLLTVVFIDVGQGDSFLVCFPNGKTALIDAGNATTHFSSGRNIIYPLMQQLEIEKLDYAFISHIDADHYLGLLYLINNRLVDTVYKPRTDFNVSKEKRFLDVLKSNHIPHEDYHKEILRVGNTSLYFLIDTTDSVRKRFDSNNKSGVIKLVYGKDSFLFTGDSEIPAEKYLVYKFGDFLNSDILKLGHHGSKTSSSETFLQKVSPKVGIISAGIKNKFHHPSKIILKRLKDDKIQYRRTDKEGAIIIQSDGENYKFIDWRNFDTFTFSN